MKKIWQLFLVFFKIGAFTFGGGYAMIPIIQREVVENKKWEDALSKLEVVLEMVEQIPKTYSLKLENIL